MYVWWIGLGLGIMCARKGSSRYRQTPSSHKQTSDVVKSVASKTTRHQLTNAMFIIIMNDDQILRAKEDDDEEEEQITTQLI